MKSSSGIRFRSKPFRPLKIQLIKNPPNFIWPKVFGGKNPPIFFDDFFLGGKFPPDFFSLKFLGGFFCEAKNGALRTADVQTG